MGGSNESMRIKSGRISTGIKGLDEITHGGLLPGNSYMLRGGPGTGKTTIGLQFLKEGAASGEAALFISLEESEQQIRTTAKELGFDISGVSFLDLSPDSAFFAEAQSYDIFSSAEVEREPISQSIVSEVSLIKPRRVFIDPLTQFRYLASDRFQFHRQVLSLFRFLSDNDATVLISSESSPEAPDNDVQFLAHCVIQLEHFNDARSLTVIKYRNSDYIHGSHSYLLTGNGAVIYPRLNPMEFDREFEKTMYSVGVDAIDKLIGGGITAGTINLISGPSGVGKTTLGMQIAAAWASQGKKAAVFTFEEEIGMILARCDSVSIPARSSINDGMLKMLKIEPLLYSEDQFAILVRAMVEEHDVKLVMIDNTIGYNLAMKKEKLVNHLHVLCKYLQNLGVTVLLIAELSNITGDFKVTEDGISHMSDNIIFMRYLEMQGELKKAIGVLKMRLGDFEKTLREYKITSEGLVIGEPLTNLRGILRGEPEWIK